MLFFFFFSSNRINFLVLRSRRLHVSCTLYKNKTLRSSKGSHNYPQFLLLLFSSLSLSLSLSFLFHLNFLLIPFLLVCFLFLIYIRQTNGIFYSFLLYPGRLWYKRFHEGANETKELTMNQRLVSCTLSNMRLQMTIIPLFLSLLLSIGCPENPQPGMLRF